MVMTTPSLDEVLQALGIIEGHDDYRVLRRHKPRSRYNTPGAAPIFRAAMLDLETTSTDTDSAEVIELGIARFTFDANGVIYDVEDQYNGLSQPSQPLEPIITEITGLTDEELRGQMIAVERVAEVLVGVDLCIAFNAGFDRRVAEHNFPGLGFDKRKWACAQKQVPWVKYGAITGKLENVVLAAGMFYDAHRALADVLASIAILATMARDVNADDEAAEVVLTNPMAEILGTTKGGAVRVMAHGAPFEVKDKLKARGYQWRGKKPWFIDVPSEEHAAHEIEWLTTSRYATSPGTVKIPARHRYSKREDALMYVPEDDHTGGY